MQFNDFPLELVYRIFLAGMADLETEANARPFYSYPTTLSSICKHWKNAARSCPELWSTICVELGPKSRPPGRVIKDYLRRSKDRPISLSVHLAPHERRLTQAHQKYSTKLYRLLNEVLIPYRFSWKEFDIHIVASRYPMQSLFEDVSGRHFPRLERFSVEALNKSVTDGSYADLVPIAKMLSGAPKLSSVEFDVAERAAQGYNMARQILKKMDAPTGWKSLTALTIKLVDWTPSMTLKLLARNLCPNLEFLSVVYNRMTDQRIPTFDVEVVHPRLRTLHLTSHAKTNRRDLCGMTLNHLSAPQLRSLELRYESSLDEERLLQIVDTIWRFTTRSGPCPLERFLIHVCGSSRRVFLLRQCVKALPASVTDLDLRFGGGGEELHDVTEVLTLSPNPTQMQGVFLPRLRDISFDIGCIWDAANAELLLAMLSSRLDMRNYERGIATLRNVRIKAKGSWRKGLEDRLANLLLEGNQSVHVYS